MKVTLDTNVFGPIADPSAYPTCPDISSCRALRGRIELNKILAHISLGSLGLEALCHNKRIDEFFRQWAANKSCISIPAPNVQRMNIFNECLRLGMKVLRVHNIALGSFIKVPQEAWAADVKFPAEERQKRLDEFADTYKDHGLDKLVQLGAELVLKHRIDTSSIPSFLGPPERVLWLRGIVQEFDSRKNSATLKSFTRDIRGLVSEWCDRDILASHYAYGNDYFCTFDNAEKAGKSSILHPNNRARLASDFGITVIAPADLVKLM